MEKVTETIFADTSGKNGGNYGLVILEDEIVYIDSGMYHHFTKDGLESIRKQHRLPVTKMILTHYHSDHILGAQGLGGVSIISSKETYRLHFEKVTTEGYLDELRGWAEESKSERPDFWKAVQSLSLKIPDIVFQDSILIGKNNELLVEKLGGHTAGSSVVIHKQEGAIFVGDLIFNQSIPYAGDPSCNPDEWIKALESIHSRNFSKIIPGHGILCDNETISEHINFLRTLRELVKEGIADGITPEEFVESGRVPDFYIDERSQHRISTAATTWFKFYQNA